MQQANNTGLQQVLGRIEAKIDVLCNHGTKIIFALVGVIAASVGLKFVGSPLLTDLFAYASFFTATFLLASVVFFWKKLNWIQRALRLDFVIFIMFSAAMRLFVYQPGAEPAPEWYPRVIDAFFVTLAILLVIHTWVDRRDGADSNCV